MMKKTCEVWMIRAHFCKNFCYDLIVNVIDELLPVDYVSLGGLSPFRWRGREEVTLKAEKWLKWWASSCLFDYYP